MKERASLLTAQTRYDLADLCMRMGLEPAGPSETKAQTAARLIDAIDGHADLVRHCFGLSCLDALASAMPSPEDDWTLSFDRAGKSVMLEDALNLLLHFGLAWRDRRRWHLLPQVRELVSLTEDERKELELVDLMLQHMIVALNRFGAAPITVALGIHGEADAEDPETAAVLAMLTMYSRFYGLVGFCPGPDGTLWMRSQECDRLPETITAQLTCMQRGVSWHEGGLEGLNVVGQCVVPLTDKALEILHELIPDTLENDPDSVAEILEDAFCFLQDGERGDALEALCELFEVDELTEARRWMLDRLLNQMPLWSLLGHTTSEMSALDGMVREKPKPDDPCPCGSGRTWARCHGRLN